MAGVNVSNSGLLFTNYIKDVAEFLNNESKARNLVKQRKDWKGSHLEWPLHTARNPSIGYVEDGAALPVPDRQRYARCKAYRKFVVGSIQLTDGIMATASGGPAVAKDVVSSEVDGMMKGLLKYENGFFFRDGTGVVATVKTGTTGTTLIADNATLLWDNAVYEVYDSNLSTLRGTLQVSSTASAPTASGYATVTTAATVPVGTTNGDKLVWAGTGSTSALNRAITGLDKLIDDAATTNFQNISTITHPRYTSLVLDNGGVAQDMTPTLFRQMLAGIATKAGAAPKSLKVMTSYWDAINFEEMYEGELRLTPDSKVAGLAVASFQTSLGGRVDIMTDADCPAGKMFFVDASQITRAVQKELAWRKDQGGGIFKRSDTSLVFTATAVEICDLYINERHRCGKIENLTHSKVTVY